MVRMLMWILVWMWCGMVTAQEPILQARSRPEGSVVTIEGIVLNGPELGVIRYVQDSSGGIALYPGGTVPAGFAQLGSGDKVRITGVLARYKGLLEVNPVLSFTLLSPSNSLPVPALKDPSELTDADQSTLIRIRCAVFAPSREGFREGKNQFHTQKGVRSFVNFHEDHPMIRSTVPDGSHDLTVIASWEDGLQFLLRETDDIQPAPCFFIGYTPQQSAIVEDGFQVQWESSENGSTVYRIERASGDVQYGTADNTTKDHQMTFADLMPAEFCHVRAGAANTSGDTAWFPDIPMTTRSQSSGEINVYFNRSIDDTYSNGGTPSGIGSAAMLSSVADLILDASHTIDIAMYNSNRDDIIGLLEDAKDRGVRVRMIADGLQNNSALDPLPSFPVFFRTSDGIMHHKFLVIDPQDASKAVVWTGSTNHSSNQIAQDPNNAIVIHDQAIAKAYLHEFHEMWGDSTTTPNIANSRTGSAKADDTPHLFQVGNVPVEVYFSPSDGTNGEILSEIEDADNTLDVGLLLLTRYDLSEGMADRALEGVDVRVIVNDLASSANQIEILEDGGVRTAHHDLNAIFHHKYAIVDEGRPDGVVITGSHNWTTSATTINDENTLILHDATLANIYRQEFEARWAELISATNENSVQRITVFPNPAGSWIRISSERTLQEVALFSVHGARVSMPQISESLYDLTALPSGLYHLVLTQENASVHLPLIKME